MTDRWVCKRCFADNDGAAMACARCGLTRGSEVTLSDQQAWATAAGVPGPAPEPPAWRRWIRFWWIPVVLIALGVGWFTAARRDDGGALTEAGTVSVTDLRPGDCFNTSADEEEISDVDGVPCDESHEYEVYVVQDREGDTYPTEAEFDAIFDSICVSAFEGVRWRGLRHVSDLRRHDHPVGGVMGRR